MDVWILREGWRPAKKDLVELVECVMSALPVQVTWEGIAASHPYTAQGLEVQALWQGKPLEVLECGLASQEVLKQCGLPGWGGLALGMGLDRMCMLAKGLDDIRWLDDPDPKAQAQMSDLEPWKKWSRQPGCTRDISITCHEDMLPEQVVDKAAAALDKSEWLESIEVVGRWLPSQLPDIAKQRLGMGANQVHWLLRLHLRDWQSSISKEQADKQARLAWEALNEGSSNLYRPGG